MIRAKILFSMDEAIQLFRNAGLKVDIVNVPTHFPTHGSGEVIEDIPMWTVQNPFTNEPENLETCFQKFIESKKSELFLTPGKLEVYNIFNKKQS